MKDKYTGISKKLMSKSGFTMAEIIIVIIIIGVVASLAIPRISVQMQRMKNQEAENVLWIVYRSQQDRIKDFGSATTNWAELDVDNPSSLLANFGAIVLSNGGAAPSCGGSSPAYFARTTANGGAYSLYATDDGIVCSPCAGICQKMGYIPY